MNIVLIGPQGSGKGVVSKFLSENYGYYHISTGDLFREEIKKGTELGKILASYMNQGLLVPNDIVFEILSKTLNKNKNYIIDGFPRNMEQAKKLSEITDVNLVIYVTAPKEILLQRLSARRYCPKCGENYSVINYSKKVCQKCGANILQRDDDFPEAINKRLDIFYQNIEPLLEYYKIKGVLVELNNSGDLNQTYSNLEKIIQVNQK